MTTIHTCFAEMAADVSKAVQSLDSLEARLADFGTTAFRNDMASFWLEVDCIAELAADLQEDAAYHNAHHVFSRDAMRAALTALDHPIELHRAKFTSQLADARIILSSLQRAVSDRDYDQLNQQALSILKLASQLDEPPRRSPFCNRTVSTRSARATATSSASRSRVQADRPRRQDAQC